MENYMRYARISGTGSFLPERIVSNSELALELSTRNILTSDRWIVERTGIHQRHLAKSNVTSSQLAIEAAKLALNKAHLEPLDLDLIIVATSTPDHVFPSTACLVQTALGATKSAAFDIQAACSGFIYALIIAENFICAGNMQNLLVIGSEVFSKLIDWNDRNTCVLFGDGAGATVVTASLTSGIISTHMMSDGNLTDILSVKGNIANGKIIGDPFLRMDGQSVFKKAILALEDSARLVCDRANINPNDIDWFIPHQANIRILHLVAQRLGISMKKIVITLDKHANTSAASIPLALDKACNDNRIKPGDLVLMQGVGAGFTWGSVLMRI
ncbi:MAG: ketoacyl-ACP synthase III [Bordetella sp.]|nr:MAG: ketoacyl-ACP synthase III [Bordetella sp.]